MTNSPKDTDAERGLVILSALVNFIDWMDGQDVTRMPFTKQKRGEIVLEFLKDNSDGRHCFKQATDIAARLGVPLGRPNNPDVSLERVAEKILDYLNFDISVPSVQEDAKNIAHILNENWDA